MQTDRTARTPVDRELDHTGSSSERSRSSSREIDCLPEVWNAYERSALDFTLMLHSHCRVAVIIVIYQLNALTSTEYRHMSKTKACETLSLSLRRTRKKKAYPRTTPTHTPKNAHTLPTHLHTCTRKKKSLTFTKKTLVHKTIKYRLHTRETPHERFKGRDGTPTGRSRARPVRARCTWTFP